MQFSICRLKKERNLGTKGLTLVETVMALALLGIVLVSVFTFYFFATNTYTVAQKKSNVQHDVLFAAEFVSNELRTAMAIDLSMYEKINQGNEAYNCSIGLKDGYIEYHYKGKSKPLTNSNIIEFNLALNKDSNLLEFNIIGEEDGKQYSIYSSITLLNLEEIPTQSSSGIWVHYYNPSSE
ncbi:MAG: hypothetical protein GX054_00810 [Clostridiales bacterium]|jgi:type II secretory pathway pseudopilin PulG|nr:hypothetical protein [Clostridiales bacterium]